MHFRTPAKTKIGLIGISAAIAILIPMPGHVQSLNLTWTGYGHDAQHTAISAYAAGNLATVKWSKPVDLVPQYSSGDLFIHYGSAMITASNTVIFPVKTGAGGGYRFDAVAGSTGTSKWSISTDYILPPHDWTPSVNGVMTPKNRFYFPGAGGTVYYRDNPDTNGGGATGQLAFFGLANYNANPGGYNNNVFINTPITSDRYGSIYFGVMVTGNNPGSITSGIAKIRYDGVGSITPVTVNGTANPDTSMKKVAHNCAPGLSVDGKLLYVGVSGANGSNASSGYLLSLNTANMTYSNRIRLKDPKTLTDASLHDDGTSSPTIGPDGDVYYGVLENSFGTNHARGYLLHFNGALTVTKTPAAFGWDDTASIVPASMVSGYAGPSTYLLCIKYNNYAGVGGDGVNKVAVVDPNQSAIESISGINAMLEIRTVTGATPDSDFRPGKPLAVREWCINTAAVDPATHSIIVNSEDGMCYRWNLDTNSLSQVVFLAPPTGEAYTPTVIGPDGTVYAINNATLNAIGP